MLILRLANLLRLLIGVTVHIVNPILHMPSPLKGLRSLRMLDQVIIISPEVGPHLLVLLFCERLNLGGITIQ